VITLALVLTPVASAQALAALCALDGMDVDVVPSSRGAVVVRAVGAKGRGLRADKDGAVATGPGEASPDAASDAASDEGASDWDISELFDDEAVPGEAHELAARISQLTRIGVVLLTARLTEDGALESGLSGHISARRYIGGEPAEDLAAGLVLAGADDVVEDLLLGRVSVADVRGHVSARDAGRGRRARWMGKGLRRPRP
jgi:hypothetical protein